MPPCSRYLRWKNIYNGIYSTLHPFLPFPTRNCLNRSQGQNTPAHLGRRRLHAKIVGITRTDHLSLIGLKEFSNGTIGLNYLWIITHAHICCCYPYYSSAIALEMAENPEIPPEAQSGVHVWPASMEPISPFRNHPWEIASRSCAPFEWPATSALLFEPFILTFNWCRSLTAWILFTPPKLFGYFPRISINDQSMRPAISPARTIAYRSTKV